MIEQDIHICHLSVLNPVRHTRIYYKYALSQVRLGYKVSIIAQGNEKEISIENGVKLISRGTFHRLGIKRLFSWLSLYFKGKAQKADIYFIHSPELLFTAYLLKLGGASCVYDVHEDYALTIKHAKHYPSWLRKFLASLILSIEKWSSKWLDGIIYAEQCYDNILYARNYIVLENTFSSSSSAEEASLTNLPDRYLLYTGTIAPEWGIFSTLSLWKKWRAIEAIPLLIAGFTYQQKLLDEIQDWLKEERLEQQCMLIGGNTYVPYHHIISLIRNCTALTALYELTPVLEKKIPTKFYEGLANKKPLIYTSSPFWNAFNQEHNLGISWGENAEVSDLISRLRDWEATASPESYQWEFREEKRLASFLKKQENKA